RLGERCRRLFLADPRPGKRCQGVFSPAKPAATRPTCLPGLPATGRERQARRLQLDLIELLGHGSGQNLGLAIRDQDVILDADAAEAQHAVDLLPVDLLAKLLPPLAAL